MTELADVRYVLHYGRHSVSAQAYGQMMGTRCSITVVDDPGEALDTVRSLWVMLHALDRNWSRFRERSELSDINRMCRSSRHSVTLIPSPSMLTLIKAIKWAYDQSNGRVDASLLDEVIAAGYDSTFAVARKTAKAPQQSRGPSISDIHIVGESVTLPPAMGLDSGGVGKGLAADMLAHAAREHPGALIDLGGDIRANGRNHNGEPWRVGIADELRPHEMATVDTWEVLDGGIATSSVTRRKWRGGHHLIDPSTRAPSESDLASVTVEADTALAAETYAKAALIGGSHWANTWLPMKARRFVLTSHLDLTDDAGAQRTQTDCS